MFYTCNSVRIYMYMFSKTIMLEFSHWIFYKSLYYRMLLRYIMNAYSTVIRTKFEATNYVSHKREDVITLSKIIIPNANQNAINFILNVQHVNEANLLKGRPRNITYYKSVENHII